MSGFQWLMELPEGRKFLTVPILYLGGKLLKPVTSNSFDFVYLTEESKHRKSKSLMFRKYDQTKVKQKNREIGGLLGAF